MKRLIVMTSIVLLVGCQSEHRNSALFKAYKNSSTSLPDPCQFNCSSSDKSSPWNFHLNFEDNSWRSKLKPNDKGMGLRPFQIQQESSGNKFVAITVKDGWNSDTGYKNAPTERSELQTVKKSSFGKEVWYGFRAKVPNGHPTIEDRFLITQFKQMAKNKPSPMMSITQRDNARLPPAYEVSLSVCGPSGSKGSYFGKFKSGFNQKIYILCGTKAVESEVTHDITKVSWDLLKEDWSSFVIGTYVTNTQDGFLKVFYEGELIFHYKGPTYGWGSIVESVVRIGIYRDGDPFGGEYPPQTVHYDDFVIGSSKDDVTKVLWK